MKNNKNEQMKTNKDKKVVWIREELPNKETQLEPSYNVMGKSDRLKKTTILGLMGIVFLGCMYLIFRPSEDKEEIGADGMNDAVPQATDAGLPEDKSEAYEQESLQKRNNEKRNTLTTLADYWSMEGGEKRTEGVPEEGGGRNTGNNGNPTDPSLASYRNMQGTLGSFYRDDGSETEELRRQLEELREELAEKEVPQPVTVDDQLTLMEKSYEMAAKYLPTNGNATKNASDNGTVSADGQDRHFMAFAPAQRNAVSALYREPSDSAFVAHWSETRNRGFYTVGTMQGPIRPKNGIKACVHGQRKVIGETEVKLRLLEPARTADITIPEGTVLTASTGFRGGRLQLEVSSLQLEGHIVPVDLTAYDLDGQQGLYVPYSPETDAMTEMAGNMAQTSGTSVMLARSAGQQVAADLSRGVVQGVSKYFSKKVRTPKITLKAGHQVFLVSKQ